jgi:hypothetical protein
MTLNSPKSITLLSPAPLSYDDNRSSCLRIELRLTSDLCHCQRVVMLIPLWLGEGTGDSAGVK